MASTAGTGYITSASEMTNKLYSENRDYNNKKTWESLYNSNDVAAAQAQQSLTKSYTDSSVDAYVSNLQSQQAIKNSNVVGSSKQQLMDAYNAQYQQNASELYSSYYDYQNQIEQSHTETQNEITEALEQQGEYSADFTNSHYDYLEYLFENNPELFENSNWQKYTTIDATVNDDGKYVDENGEEITEEEAKELYGTRLKSWEELSAVQKDGDLYSSIYDENGNLTTFGTEFFDQLENDFMNEGDLSWNNWLKETNEELYNWAYNDYNYYNYTAAGTNAGTLKTMYGMMSTDNTYSYLERFGGMTETQIDVYFDKFNEAIESLGGYIEGGVKTDKNGDVKLKTNNHWGKDRTDKRMDAITEAMGDLFSSLGLEDYVDAALEDAGFQRGYEGMTDLFNSYAESLQTTWDVILEACVNGAIDAAVIAKGVAEVATGGGAVQGVFDIIYGATMLVTNVVSAISQVGENKETNYNLSNQMYDTASQFAVWMTDIKNSVLKNTYNSQYTLLY